MLTFDLLFMKNRLRACSINGVIALLTGIGEGEGTGEGEEEGGNLGLWRLLTGGGGRRSLRAFAFINFLGAARSTIVPLDSCISRSLMVDPLIKLSLIPLFWRFYSEDNTTANTISSEIRFFSWSSFRRTLIRSTKFFKTADVPPFFSSSITASRMKGCYNKHSITQSPTSLRSSAEERFSGFFSKQWDKKSENTGE